MCDRVDIPTHAAGLTCKQFALDNPVTLLFDLYILESLHVENLPQTISLPTLALIAQAFSFYSEDKTEKN